jgi:hypothetical protein
MRNRPHNHIMYHLQFWFVVPILYVLWTSLFLHEYLLRLSGLRFVAVLTDVCRFRCRPFHKSTRTLYNKMSTNMCCFTRPHIHANFEFDGIHGFDTSLSITIHSTFTCGSGPLLRMAGYSSPQGGYKLLV